MSGGLSHAGDPDNGGEKPIEEVNRGAVHTARKSQIGHKFGKLGEVECQIIDYVHMVIGVNRGKFYPLRGENGVIRGYDAKP
jgi:hypothetical protein